MNEKLPIYNINYHPSADRYSNVNDNYIKPTAQYGSKPGPFSSQPLVGILVIVPSRLFQKTHKLTYGSCGNRLNAQRKRKKTDTWIPENKRNKSENRDRNKLNSNSSKEVQCQK